MRAEELYLHYVFKIGSSGLVVSHLQYADDTLLVIKPSLDKLWCIKAILRSFEKDFGLRVNFFKSSLTGGLVLIMVSILLLGSFSVAI